MQSAVPLRKNEKNGEGMLGAKGALAIGTAPGRTTRPLPVSLCDLPRTIYRLFAWSSLP